MNYLAYIGTYTTGASDGIYCIDIETSTGHIDVLNSFGAKNPSYLAVSKDAKYLFSTCESDKVYKISGGSALSFEIQKNGRLKKLSQRSTVGTYPCYLSLSGDGIQLYTANYGDGTTTVFSVLDGILSEAMHVVRHEGHGPNQDRQKGPHSHCVEYFPQKEIVCIVDLGIDQVRFYRSEKCDLRYQNTFFIAPGSGPRHIVFSKDGRFAWVVCELSNEIYALNIEEGYALIGVYPTLPKGYNGNSTCAAIKLSPNNKTLCVSNRGHDSIAYFKVISVTGSLELTGIYPSGGKTPRDIAFTPDGRLLLVGNQNSNILSVFEVKKNRLIQTDENASIPSPTCIVFCNGK
jgi:6-phosphogluconolactonase